MGMAAVRRIVVGVHGSLGSLQALRYAAAEARERDVPLVPAIAWLPPGGDLAERRCPSPYLRQIWRNAARDRLLAAFEAGLGGIPGDLTVQPCVERGEAGPMLVAIANEPDDLIVIGTGRRSLIGRTMRKSVGRHCLAHAKCPVLAIPPSALMDEVGRRTRPWSPRARHILLPDISEFSDK
jgi:nucleotide-binding universal stress UspA family protein